MIRSDTWVLWAALIAVAIHGGPGALAEVAVTPQQIEDDWLRQADVRNAAPRIQPQQDATGACDGVKNGLWGFHTNHEPQPWWQVDLGNVTTLGAVHIYNRCDGSFASRAGRLRILASTDGKKFDRVYTHDGTTFYGFTDNAPLVAEFRGVSARYVRIQIPGKDYLHLDEVEVYGRAGGKNLALGKPATQSSVSQWSVAGRRHRGIDEEEVLQVVHRGEQLAAQLASAGVDVARSRDLLRNAKRRARKTDKRDRLKASYFEAQRAVRTMTLANPLLDFDDILFVKRAPTLFPHVSDQYYGWFSRGGGGVYRLDGFRSGAPELRCLTEGWPLGSFLRPCLSYDGAKVLFAYCRYYPELAEVQDKTDKEALPEAAFYHLFEMNLDGSGVRQLTRGYYDDFDGRYLPNGDIIFLSTRKGTALQAGRQSASATCAATQPDSYVRCGGGRHRPVAVFTLHRMNADGGDLLAISAFENFEWTPAIGQDGRILYARWDYIDRFNADYMSLWATNPDGTNARLVYGNYTTKPQCIFEARPIPGSRKLVFTATAHHSITGGSLVMLDRTKGTEFEAPLTRLTREVCFPETEGWPRTYYANPWPLSEQYYLVSWSDRALPPHSYMAADAPNNPRNAAGIYLYDAFGNLTLLHRDPEISSMNPLPIRPRPLSADLPDLVDWDAPKKGCFLVQDVYQGLDGVERGAVKRLRVVGVVPKVQPEMNQPSLGVTSEETGKFVLGTVPVEEDGSAYFEVPSGISVFFQALDERDMAFQTMRSLTYVQPGQTLSCIGCHDSRDGSPRHAKTPAAARRAPSRLAPGPDGSWPLRFDQLVQPVLDRACVDCHGPGGRDRKAARFDLTGEHSYDALLTFANNDLHHLVWERPRSEVGECAAQNSKILALLTQEDGHEGVELSADDLERLITWMDTYAHKQGAFSEEQEKELIAFKREMARLP